MSGPTRAGARSFAVSLALLLGAGAFLLTLLGSHVVAPGYPAKPAGTPTFVRPTTAATHAPPSGPGPSSDATARPVHEVGSLVVGLYLALVAGALLLLAVLVAQALSQRARHRRRDRAAESGPRGYDLQPGAVAQRMADAAAAGLDDLAAEGPVADAIIACWQRLRAAAAEAGVAPVASDTPEQAIARVLDAVSGAAAAPLTTLAGLYREARFSQHELSRGDVWVARQALQAILAQLRPQVPGAH